VSDLRNLEDAQLRRNVEKVFGRIAAKKWRESFWANRGKKNGAKVFGRIAAKNGAKRRIALLLIVNYFSVLL
jgi:hypothetical protein